MNDSQVLAFAGIAAVLTITPGADTVLVIRTVIGRGRLPGIVTALGICLGVVVHGSVSALGVSAILVRSALAFETVRTLGVCYLIYLGVQSILAGRREKEWNFSDDRSESQINLRRAFAQGLFSNLLNPKVSVFYLAFLPQFISMGDPVFLKSLLLAGLHSVMGIIWLTAVAMLIERLRRLISSRVFRQRLEAVSGAVLILFGLRLAFADRN